MRGEFSRAALTALLQYGARMEALIVPRRGATYGTAVAPRLPWSAAAEQRLQRIPSFVRGVVIERLENYASRHGKAEITVELMQEVRRSMPVDFSKKLPFFVRDDD